MSRLLRWLLQRVCPHRIVEGPVTSPQDFHCLQCDRRWSYDPEERA
jgi:hypothetical protein